MFIVVSLERRDETVCTDGEVAGYQKGDLLYYAPTMIGRW